MPRHLPRVAFALASLAWLAIPSPASAQAGWQQPPPEILQVLHAPDLPVVSIDPGGTTFALAERVRYPPIAELAEPMLRLGGVRVNPRTNGLHAAPTYAVPVLQRIDDGARTEIGMPADSRILRLSWSPDSRFLALTRRAEDGVELWIAEARTGRARLVPGMKLNPMLGPEIAWMPDSARLVVKRIPASRGPAPARPLRPEGPNVQESAGGTASSTYEARDLLAGPHEEALFAHHALAQVAFVDAVTLQVTDAGEPGLIAAVAPSPDGSLLLVESVRPPFSRRVAWWRFPQDVEIRDPAGRVVHVIARLPAAESVPIHGVPEGPRDAAWRPTAPATLTWLEALDGGDWSRKVPHRDRMLAQDAPFHVAPREIHLATHRIDSRSWGERGDLLLVDEYERERRWRHGWALHPDTRGAAPVKIFDLSENERYGDPGTPVERVLPNGHSAIVMGPQSIFLAGSGAGPGGDRPFLDELSLRTRRARRLFRSAPGSYERFVDFAGGDSRRLVVRSESPTEPPNYFELSSGRRVAAEAGEAAVQWRRRPLTALADPAPVLRGIGKRIVRFRRADGVEQSFTLYTPPGWKGEALPTVLYAYPLEFSDPGTAGQVSGTEHSFTRLAGPSHLFLLLSGYAVLHDVTMPVIGDPDTAYDTFVEQLVASAAAAIDEAVRLGVTDRDRVAAMGHSHGALMTATLLAHSDLFRAGIARSGAYNHTMRPFGFQSERRTLWEATDTYVKLSPVMHAPRIDEPLLIIHGEVDQNPGTVPLQSEKLYDAIRGTGGTARLVMLPHEMHGYASREATEHVLAEQLAWLDRFVRNAAPRPPRQAEHGRR